MPTVCSDLARCPIYGSCGSFLLRILGGTDCAGSCKSSTVLAALGSRRCHSLPWPVLWRFVAIQRPRLKLNCGLRMRPSTSARTATVGRIVSKHLNINDCATLRGMFYRIWKPYRCRLRPGGTSRAPTDWRRADGAGGADWCSSQGILLPLRTINCHPPAAAGGRSLLVRFGQVCANVPNIFCASQSSDDTARLAATQTSCRFTSLRTQTMT